jgi:hypothetical protein
MSFQDWSRFLGLTREGPVEKPLLPSWLYFASAVIAAVLVVLLLIRGADGRMRVGVILLAAFVPVLLAIAVSARRRE